MLRTAVLNACDRLDGAQDSIISDTAQCDQVFDVTSLRCPGGADSGDTCLSDPQIAALNVSNSRMQFGFELQSGVSSFPRWPIFHTGYTDTDAILAPFPPNNRPLLNFLDQPLIAQFVIGNPAYDSINFNPDNYIERLQEVSETIDANSVAIEDYRSRGGKLLLLHGTTDYLNPPGASIDYYERLVERFGQTAAGSFVRFYLVPGYGHGNGEFTVSWDSLPVLEAWAERGQAPGPQVVTDVRSETAGRTRPLCLYPTFPRLNSGVVDTNSASNFSCVSG